MKLTVLTDNLAGSKFLAEHGLSYLIEIDGQTILFDTGHSNVFMKNAKLLGIDLQRQVDQIVLSHGHWDHGNGLQYINRKRLTTHPGSFIKRYSKPDNNFIGLKLTKELAHQQFDLTTSTTPILLTENLYFLGEIPRNNDFESQSTTFKDEFDVDDFVPDDSAIAIVKNDKLIIISGCAHAGICNICEHAKDITGISTIETVIGGFHLKLNNKQTQDTIRYFKQEKVVRLYPSHCTQLPALAEFYIHFESTQLKTGQIIEL